jgi:hypothetical protein
MCRNQEFRESTRTWATGLLVEQLLSRDPAVMQAFENAPSSVQHVVLCNICPRTEAFGPLLVAMVCVFMANCSVDSIDKQAADNLERLFMECLFTSLHDSRLRFPEGQLETLCMRLALLKLHRTL